MSLDSWIEEFYPIEAEDQVDNDHTDKQLLESTLQKWIGLRKENLDKHGIAKDGSGIGCNNNYLAITASSCTLCYKYADFDGCDLCPLYVHLGFSCGSSLRNGQYDIWLHTNNPEPMIKVLQELLEKHND